MDRQYAPLEVRPVRQSASLCKPERGISHGEVRVTAIMTPAALSR